MVLVRFKSDLNNELVSFSALTLLVWLSVIIVPELTYNVLSRMLSLYTTTTITMYNTAV